MLLTLRREGVVHEREGLSRGSCEDHLIEDP